jgi:hypothetical protein
MSKRFGRNQRRRAREQLAAAVAATQVAQRQADVNLTRLKDSQYKFNILADFFDIAADMVGKQAYISNMATVLNVNYVAESYRAIPQRNFVSAGMSIPETACVTTEVLHLLSIESVADGMSNQMGVRVVTQGERR